MHIDDAVYGTGNDAGDGQDNDRKQDIGKNPDQWLAQMAGIDNPIQAYNKAERNRHAPECIDKNELPGRFIRSEMAGDALVNDAVDGDAGGKGNGENAAGQDKHFQKMSPVNPAHPFHI